MLNANVRFCLLLVGLLGSDCLQNFLYKWTLPVREGVGTWAEVEKLAPCKFTVSSASGAVLVRFKSKGHRVHRCLSAFKKTVTNNTHPEARRLGAMSSSQAKEEQP